MAYVERKSEYIGCDQQLLTFVEFCDTGHILTIRVLGLVGPLVFLTLGHSCDLGLLRFGPIMNFSYNVRIWAILGF